MVDERWFRNTRWNHATAAAFEEKLRRARRKNQYLRIQACPWHGCGVLVGHVPIRGTCALDQR